jgi:FkbM family methyltransferase
MNLMGRLALGSLKAYSRVAPTERGGYRLARLARRFVSESEREGIFTTPDGLRMRLDLRTYPDVNMAVGLYELDTYRLIRNVLRPGQWFVDVGANVGYFTLLAAKWVGATGRVDALEPDPINRGRLEMHLRENQLESRVRVHPVAASAQAGEVKITHPESTGSNHGMASMYKSLTGEGETFTVPTVRLDEMFDEVPNMIKIDVEGAELQVLEGLAKLLRAEHPPTLIIEHNWTSCIAAGYRPSNLFLKLKEIQPNYEFAWISWPLMWPIRTAEALDSIKRQGNIVVDRFQEEELNGPLFIET